MGHSMGGLISVMTALKRPDLLAGALLSAPLLKVCENISYIIYICLSYLLLCYGHVFLSVA